MKKNFLHFLLAATVMVTGLSGSVMTETETVHAATTYSELKVSAKDGYYGIQDALDTARDRATSKKRYRVVLGKGTYTLYHALHIYSNTYLDASKATLRVDKGVRDNLIKIGTPGDDPSHGYHYRNISIVGGHWNRGGDDGTTMKLAHARNVTVKNCELYNCNDGHLIETAGVNGLKIIHCNFHDTKSGDAFSGGECIQLDILVKKHFTGYRYLDSERDYVSKNITISNCTFKNVVKAIGSHTAVYGIPFTNVKITNNRMSGIPGEAILLGGTQGVTVKGNTIRSVDNGIDFYVVKDTLNGNYLSKHHSNKYQDPPVNAVISDNNVTSTRGNAIYLHGTKFLTSRKGDGDRMPAGNYAIKNIKIKNNIFCSTIAYNEKNINTYKSPVLIVNGYNVSLSKNRIYGGKYKNGRYINGYNAVYIKDGSRKISIRGNQITGHFLSAIRTFTRTPDPDKYGNVQINSISNNIIRNSGDNGIVLMNGNIGTIANNRIYGCSFFGIRVDKGVRIKHLASSNKFDRTRRLAAYRIYPGSSIKSKK